MPVVLRIRGYRFLFFSNEGDPREPTHVHVRKGEKVAKIWLEPKIQLAEAYRMNSRELRKLVELVEIHEETIRRAWHRHFGE
ncbi:MAG: DUF4160 domain-containing protein [Phycisphaerales bacterium]|nr:DUF4160 domain-containing protein [Phycisphaerales bacterium]